MASVSLIRNGHSVGYVAQSAAQVNFIEEDGSKTNLQTKIQELEQGGGGGGDASISKVEGNIIERKPDGLYATAVKELTQEEYDALSEAEKKSRMYIVQGQLYSGVLLPLSWKN